MTDEIIKVDCQGEGPEFVERAEIARLREQLTEAREIMKPLAKAVILDDHMHEVLLSSETLRRARAFLKGETDESNP